MKINKLTIVLLAAAAVSGVASAQRGLRPQEITGVPGFADSRMGVLLRNDVAYELHMDNRQKDDVARAVMAYFGPRREFNRDGRDRGFDDRRGGVQPTYVVRPSLKQFDALYSTLYEKLDRHQKDRFNELYIQFEGPCILLTDTRLRDQMGLNGDQNRHIDEIRRELDRAEGTTRYSPRLDNRDWDRNHPHGRDYDAHRFSIVATPNVNRQWANTEIDHMIDDRQFHILRDQMGRDFRFDSRAAYYL